MLFEPYEITPYSDWSDPELRASFADELERVRGMLGRDYPLWIGGDRIDTDAMLVSTDPCAPDTVVGRTAMAGAAHIDLAFQAAEQAFASWSARPMAFRARALIKLAAVMRRRKRELAAWEVFEASKNWLEAEADVAEAIDFCEYYARQALDLEGPLDTYHFPGEENTTSLSPLGVGVVIPPWNFLLAILVGTVVGPVVVGNTVIVKPSPKTPILAQKMMECVEEAGFPPGVINLLTGADADLGDALVDDARTMFINFTGSVRTGTRILERAAKVQPGQHHIKRVQAEMGGKDALVVDETADLDHAAAVAVASGFGFQGQKCSAMSRLIVVDEVYDDLLAKVVERTKALRLDAAENDGDVCAVIDEAQYEKILGYLRAAPEQGEVLVGGGAADRPGWFIEPTVVAGVAPDAPLAQEEIFGPVVSVLRARDFDHAVEIHNGTDYALTGGLCSASRDRIARARAEFACGNLYIIQPFGGYRLSGSNAKAGGPDYLRLFMLAKTVSERY